MFSGSTRFRGNVINLPQDIKGFVSSLPRLASDLPLTLVVRKSFSLGDNTVKHKDFRVRRNKILQMLEFLKLNHPKYSDIEINWRRLEELPEDDHIGIDNFNIRYVEDENVNEDSEQEDVTMGHEPGPNVEDAPETVAMESFLPLSENSLLVDAEIDKKIDVLAYPELSTIPVNEFETHGLAGMCFPARFPRGSGDPTFLSNRINDVKLAEGFKHLIKLRVWSPSKEKFVYPFAEARFANWSENMIKRKRALSQAAFFLKRNPSTAALDLQDLKNIARDPQQRLSLVNKLSVYGANLSGSRPY